MGAAMTAIAASAWAQRPPPIPPAPPPRRGGKKKKAVERFAESVPRDPRAEGDERRLIHVTEVEMFGAGEIIQLVAKDSVATSGEKMEEEFRKREAHHNRRAA